MSMTRTIEIDGKQVPFKASAAIPRIYRVKYGRDIFKDLMKLENDELFAAVHSILEHPAEEGLDGVKDILMYDEKLVFELRNGRKMTWRRK